MGVLALKDATEILVLQNWVVKHDKERENKNILYDRALTQW